MREIVIELTNLQLSLPTEEEECPYNREPNAQTLEALENIKKGKNLLRAKDAKDLLKKLGLQMLNPMKKIKKRSPAKARDLFYLKI
jgi:hypothetical protein